MQAILSVIPLDSYIPDPVQTMQVVGAPEDIPEVVAEATPLLAAQGAAPVAVERFAFYERASQTFAVVRTMETRPYGNFILSKGVIGPD